MDGLNRLWQVIRDGDSTTVSAAIFSRSPNTGLLLLIAAMGTGESLKLVPTGDPYELMSAVDSVEAFAADHGLVTRWTDTPASLDASFALAA
jgi:hypothetical protein